MNKLWAKYQDSWTRSTKNHVYWIKSEDGQFKATRWDWTKVGGTTGPSKTQNFSSLSEAFDFEKEDS